MGFKITIAGKEVRLTEWQLVALGSVTFAAIFTYLVVEHIRTPGLAWDWNLNLEMAWAAWYSVVRLHKFPLWQPWICGGYPILAHPESRILTPFFLLTLAFGPIVGLHLEVIAHAAIGFAGAYFLARRLGIVPVGAVTCAGTFMGSSWYYLHMAVGHVVFLGYVYAPWIVAFFYMSAGLTENTRPKINLAMMLATAALLALVFFEGGTVYPLPHIFLLLSFLAAYLAIERLSYRSLVAFLGIAILTLIISLPKLIPMILTIKASRPWPNNELNPLSLMVQFLFSRNQLVERVPITPWGFWEYGAYICPIFVMFAIVGVLSNFRRALPWLILSTLLFVTAMGNVGFAMGHLGEYTPWVQLHRLPLWSEMRLPSRFLILFTLCIGVLAALGADWLSSCRPVFIKPAVIVLLAAALLDGWLVSAPNMRWANEYAAPPGELTANVFSLTDNNIPCDQIIRGASPSP
jgi:hypothetical protein